MFYSDLIIKLQNIQQRYLTVGFISPDWRSSVLKWLFKPSSIFSLNIYFHIPEVHCGLSSQCEPGQARSVTKPRFVLSRSHTFFLLHSGVSSLLALIIRSKQRNQLSLPTYIGSRDSRGRVGTHSTEYWSTPSLRSGPRSCSLMS